MEGKSYITDMGSNLEMVDQSGARSELERYGVWQANRRGKYEVVEVGNDLKALMEKYCVTQDRVVPIGDAAKKAQA